MEKQTLIKAMPKGAKRLFRDWIKNGKFDLGERHLSGESLDGAIELIFDRIGFDLAGKYRIQLNRTDQHSHVIEIVDDNNVAYSLTLGGRLEPKVCVKKNMNPDMEKEFYFEEKLRLKKRSLHQYNGKFDIDVVQEGNDCSIYYLERFADETMDRNIIIHIVKDTNSFYAVGIDGLMTYVKKVIEGNSDFLGLCSELCGNNSLFGVINGLSVSRLTGRSYNPDDKFEVKYGKLRELVLTTENRQISYNGENGTWQLKTGDNFVVSKRETDDKEDYEYSYYSDSLTNDDLDNSLTPKEEIEMCESEVDEAVGTFQKILRPNRTSEYNYYFSSKDPCFVAGTLIMTDSGVKPIESIKENDLVLSYNVDIEKTELKRVVRTFIKQSSEIYKIFAGGEVIETTSGHVFYVNNQWMSAKDIKSNDKLMDNNKNIITVDKVEIVQVDTVNVYNFEVEDNHNYFVSSSTILVHNECILM